MIFDVETLKLIWAVLVTAGGVGSSIVVLWASKNFVKRAEFEAHDRSLQQEIGKLAMRLTTVETELRHAPKHSDLVALNNTVGDMGRRVAKLEGSCERTANLLESIHDHLLNEK